MAKYICLVILVVVHTVAAVPVPVALKKDAPKYSADHDHLHQEESLRSPRSTATVTASGAAKDATPVVAGTEGLLPPGSMDSLANQLKKLKEQVELYQMINDMLKAETKVQAMPYTVDQHEPQPTQHAEVAAAPKASHNEQARHEDHHEESQHDDDYHTEDDHHHNDDHHEEEHHEPQEYGKRQQRYHH